MFVQQNLTVVVSVKGKNVPYSINYSLDNQNIIVCYWLFDFTS